MPHVARSRLDHGWPREDPVGKLTLPHLLDPGREAKIFQVIGRVYSLGPR
jgi:hypothetical protein